MSLQQRHQDVAAYALGVLEPADAYRFEEHLADCVLCTVQLSDFASVAAVISPLAGSDALLPAGAPPHLLDRLTGEVALVRRRSRRRRFRLIAAAAALIVALPLAVAALRAADAPAERPSTRVTARNAATGVTASAVVRDQAWGTSVEMRLTGLTGLTGPGSCRLFAITKEGIERPVLSWKVPAGVYGTHGEETPLEIGGGTDLPSERIGR
ncbi:anti-sigma factor family protein, partial [Streptomyces sp. NPDC055078]